MTEITRWRTHLVRLCSLVEHASVNGCSHQVVGCCDGVNVTGEMEVKLKWTDPLIKCNLGREQITFFILKQQCSTSSIGMTWEYPPPAAPPVGRKQNWRFINHQKRPFQQPLSERTLLQSSPLIPKVGPWEGCRTHANTLSFMWAPKACTKPMVVVLFPSPRGVGVILQTEKNHQQGPSGLLSHPYYIYN